MIEPAMTQEEIDKLEAKKEDLPNLDMWPGYMAYVDGKGGYFSGCKNVALSVSQMEPYFQQHPGMLVVNIAPCGIGDDEAGGTEPYFLVTYTRRVSEEELRRFQRVQVKARQLLDEEDRQIAEAKQKAEEAGRKAEKEAKEKVDAEYKELKRLAELGRKHEKNCKKAK